MSCHTVREPPAQCQPRSALTHPLIHAVPFFPLSSFFSPFCLPHTPLLPFLPRPHFIAPGRKPPAHSQPESRHLYPLAPAISSFFKISFSLYSLSFSLQPSPIQHSYFLSPGHSKPLGQRAISSCHPRSSSPPYAGSRHPTFPLSSFYFSLTPNPIFHFYPFQLG